MKTAEEWMKENYFNPEDGTWSKFDDYGTLEEYAKYYHEQFDQSQQIEFPSDEEITNYFTKEHYHYQKGRYIRVDKDRIFGAKWAVKWIKDKMK